MDTYNVYFASATAATVVMRSFCGAAFPLFSPAMFDALGDQWAMSVFAILSTVCIPIPIFFWVCIFFLVFFFFHWKTDVCNRNTDGGFEVNLSWHIKTPIRSLNQYQQQSQPPEPLKLKLLNSIQYLRKRLRRLRMRQLDLPKVLTVDHLLIKRRHQWRYLCATPLFLETRNE